MHTKDARAAGETEQRAALAWTEAITFVTDGHVPDDMYELARTHFEERELVDRLSDRGGERRVCGTYLCL